MFTVVCHFINKRNTFHYPECFKVEALVEIKGTKILVLEIDSEISSFCSLEAFRAQLLHTYHLLIPLYIHIHIHIYIYIYQIYAFILSNVSVILMFLAINNYFSLKQY
jgi:hypothetical protein